MRSLPPADLIPVLLRAGVELPRGVLGDAAWELGRLTREQGAPPQEAILAASVAHWEGLREAIGAALGRAEGGDVAGLDEISPLAGSEDPANPLALALAEQAGLALAGVLERADARVASIVGVTDGGQIVAAAGAIAADCLDLSSVDFEDEIETYLRAGETPGALRDLARETGDPEIRDWAHEALDELDRRGLVRGVSQLRAVVSGSGVPPDAADDPLWIGVVTSLAEEAIDIAMAAEASRALRDDAEHSP